MTLILAVQQQSLDEGFLKDAIMERLKDDAPVVVAAALKVLEVSGVVGMGTALPW